MCTAPSSERKFTTVLEFASCHGFDNSDYAGGKGFGDPAKFDTTYFKSLLQRPWLNPSNNMAKMIGLPSDWVSMYNSRLLGHLLMVMVAKELKVLFV